MLFSTSILILLCSDQSLNRYGVDIFDQNYRNSPSPLPTYLPLPINNRAFQNGQSEPYRRNNQHRRWHDSLRDGGASRYSDLLYDVQYDNQFRQKGDELRKKERPKNKYYVVSSRAPSANDTEYGPSDYDIWKNKRWNEPSEYKEPERKFAWRDPREEHKELVALDDQRKVRMDYILMRSSISIHIVP